MTARAGQIVRELEAVKFDADFDARSSEIVDRWIEAGTGFEAVDPVLRFMESHPSLEYGMPGSLVHFAERFYGHGYERLLTESVGRRPTQTTTWMLNRLINGSTDAAARSAYVEVMKRAAENPLADAETRAQVRRFLARLTAK